MYLTASVDSLRNHSAICKQVLDKEQGVGSVSPHSFTGPGAI